MRPSPQTQTPRPQDPGRLPTRNQISYQYPLFKRGVYSVVLLLMMVSVAHADAVFTLTALTPENSVGGYLPGTIVNYRVDISQDKATSTSIRLAQMDFAASDPALGFLGDFAFDFSTVIADAYYTSFPDYPRPVLVYMSSQPHPEFTLEIPPQGSGSLSLGTGRLQLPMAYGTYLLDPLNAGTTAPDAGASINFGFINMTKWSSTDGSITGSPLALAVVPEPVTICLFGSGLIGLLGFRRRIRKP